MADNLFDEYGEINPNLPRPVFKKTTKPRVEGWTGYRYIYEVWFFDQNTKSHKPRYQVYIPPLVRGRRKFYHGIYDDLDTAIEAQRQRIIEFGVNVEYILAHLQLPVPETC